MDRSFSVRLSANVDAYVNAMNKAKQSTAGWSKETEANMRKVGGQMQTVGRNMSTFVTLPLAAVGTAAVASAVSWESSWAGVTKTVNGTAAELSKLEGDLRGMAKSLPASHKEIAAVAEAAGQLGVETSSIADFTKVMVDLGETTNLTSDEAATSIAQLMNVMQTAPDQVGNLGAALVELGNNGASTERDIIMMAQRIAGAGKIVGMSEADVLGLANALASVGIEVEAGGSSISRIMTDMAKAVSTGSEELGVFAGVAGMSSAQFSAAFEEDAAGAIASFVEGLGRVDAAGGDVFSILELLGQEDVRVARSLLTMANSGDLLRESLAMAGEAWGENSALTEEAAKRYDTTAARMEIFRNRVVDMFITVADAALPALNGILEFGGDAADAFASLPGPIQATAAGFLALVAAAGPMIWIGGSLIRNFHELKGGIAGMKTALTGMGLSAGAATTALGVFAGVVVAAGVAFMAYQSFTKEQREVAARAKEVAASLDASTQAAIENADAANGAAIAHQALSQALTSTGEDGEKLTAALGAIGLTTEDALSTLIAISGDAKGALAGLAEQYGLTAEQAKFLAEIITTDSAAGTGWTYDSDQWSDLEDVLSDNAEKLGLSKTEALALGKALEELQDQSEKTNLDKMLSSWLLTTAAASPLNQALLSQAEEMEGVKRSGDNLLPLYERYVELLKRAGVEAGNIEQSPWETVMGGIVSGADEGTAALDSFLAGLGDVGDEMEDTGVAGSDLADDLRSVADAFDAARQAGDRYRDALSMTVDPQRDLVEANEALFSTMDRLKQANKDNGDSLDIATEKGRDNRDLVKQQVDAILAYGPAARAMGKSAFDAALDQEGMRVALVDTMEQLGFNREEAEGYIATLGLTPDSLATSVTLEGQLATEEEINAILEDLDEIDEGAAAEIEALVQAGQLDDALAKVQLLKALMNEGAEMKLRVYNPGGGPVKVMARGDVVDRATLAVFGEAGAEVVLPLTNPARMAELLADPRVGPKVAAALGAHMFANGGLVGMFPPSSSGIITSNYSQFLKPASSSGSSTSEDDLQRNMHEAGATSDAEYRAYLERRLGDFEEYSNEWMAKRREMEQLDSDAAKAAEDAAAREIAAEDQRMAAMFELGEIDRAQYEAYLTQRMGAFDRYSTEWMTRWREVSQLHADAQREEQQRLEDELKAALRRQALIFDQAAAQQQLAVAERELSQSWAAVGDAQRDRGAAETDEEAARADRQIADALNRVADDAFAGAKARARVNGLEENTPEWARFVRAEIGAYAAAHPELAGRLNEWLLGVPQFAAGAYFPSRAGGSLAMLGRVAEAGQGEWVLPDAKLMSFARTMQMSAPASAATAASFDVRVFVGDQEIKDIVRTEVVRSDNDSAAQIHAGWRR